MRTQGTIGSLELPIELVGRSLRATAVAACPGAVGAGAKGIRTRPKGDAILLSRFRRIIRLLGPPQGRTVPPILSKRRQNRRPHSPAPPVAPRSLPRSSGARPASTSSRWRRTCSQLITSTNCVLSWRGVSFRRKCAWRSKRNWRFSWQSATCNWQMPPAAPSRRKRPLPARAGGFRKGASAPLFFAVEPTQYNTGPFSFGSLCRRLRARPPWVTAASNSYAQMKRRREKRQQPKCRDKYCEGENCGNWRRIQLSGRQRKVLEAHFPGLSRCAL